MKKISSKAVDTRILAIYALDGWIEYVRKINPELNPSEATLLAAILLHNLPELFEDPVHLHGLRQGAKIILEKRNAHK